MPLLTIADLNQSSQYKAAYVEHAMTLNKLWMQWKSQHDGSFTITARHGTSEERAKGLHASEVSGCQRRLVYALRNETKAPVVGGKDVNMQRRFDLGTMTHELIQWEFEQMCAWLGNSITFQPEAPVSPELGGTALQYNIYSHTDGIFTFWHEWQPYLRMGLEIKTCSEKEWELLTKPKDEHLEQTCIYMKTLDLPLMWILYYCKSNSYCTDSVAPWLFSFNSHLWDKTLEPRIIQAYQYVSNGQLPARQEGRPCGWCPYTRSCQPAYLKTGRNSSPPSPRDFRC